MLKIYVLNKIILYISDNLSIAKAKKMCYNKVTETKEVRANGLMWLCSQRRDLGAEDACVWSVGEVASVWQSRDVVCSER